MCGWLIIRGYNLFQKEDSDDEVSKKGVFELQGYKLYATIIVDELNR